jgi:hypothetical protein
MGCAFSTDILGYSFGSERTLPAERDACAARDARSREQQQQQRQRQRQEQQQQQQQQQ